MKYSLPIDVEFVYLPNFANDLDDIAKTHPAEEARIFTLLEELENVPTSLDLLTKHRLLERGKVDFTVQEIQGARARRPPVNLWRISILERGNNSTPFRLIYCPVVSERRIYFLGVMPRDIDYDLRSPFFRRVLADYGDAGLPNI